MNALARFEGFMRELMDRRMVRLLGGSLQPVELAQALGRCMDERRRPGDAAPDLFEVVLNPEECADFRALDERIETKLAQYAVEVARERGFNFQAPPRVRLVGDAELARGELRVGSRISPPHRQRGRWQPSREARRSSNEQPPRPAGLYFEVPQNGARPTELPLDHFPFVIGRREGCDLVLPDARVSRTHAVVERHGAAYRLRDLGSRNGTFLNGQPVSEADLRDGDKLAVGGFEVNIRIP